MPFVNRFASPVAPPPSGFGLVRNHPFIVASSAATAGVLLGAFIAVQVLATPEKVDAGATSAQAAAPAPPIAETTGSAPAAEPSGEGTTAAVDCDQQTWPYLSRDCMKNRGTRVVTTDKLDRSKVGAIEAPANATKPKPAPSRPVTPSATSAPTPAHPEPASTTAAAAPEPVTKPTPAAEPEQAAAKPEFKPKPKHIARKHKRKPAKQEFNDDDNNAVASDESDDRGNYRRPDRRRVVQRWNERGDDRRDFDDDGRRVIVIRRGGGGLFGSLFGNFDRGGGDDD